MPDDALTLEQYIDELEDWRAFEDAAIEAEQKARVAASLGLPEAKRAALQAATLRDMADHLLTFVAGAGRADGCTERESRRQAAGFARMLH